MPLELIWIAGVMGAGFAILGFALYTEAYTQYRRVIAKPSAWPRKKG